MEKFLNEGRLAARRLLKSPGFTVVAVLTLALGIGLNTSMFSLMNTILLKPLPFDGADRLVKVDRKNERGQPIYVSGADYLELRRQEAGLGEVAGYYYPVVSLAEQGMPAQSLRAMRVSANFFGVIGAQPHMGRFFQKEEEIEGNHHVAVLSHGLWQEKFGGDTNVIGRTIRCNGAPHEVVGVLREDHYDSRLFSRAVVFFPLGLTKDQREKKGMDFMNLLGRLGPGISKGQANSFVESFGKLLNKEDSAAEQKRFRWDTQPLDKSLMSPRGRILLSMLLGMSGFVLLIACSNLANFLLARAIARTREFAVRSALGASRWRLIAPLTMESLGLALLGGVGALVVCAWTSDWLYREASRTAEAFERLRMDWRVLGFTGAVSLLTIVLFGIAPAWFALRVNLNSALKSGTRGATSGRTSNRFRSALVIGQFALAMALLAGGGYFVRASMNALNEDNGWNADSVLQGSIQLRNGHPGGEQLELFRQELITRLKRIPGVEAASISYGMPYRGFNNIRGYVTETQPAREQERLGLVNGVSEEYFAVTGTRLLKGRLFDARDNAKSPEVAIISESLAQSAFQNADPLGKRIAVGGWNPRVWCEIVGVVADVRSADVGRDPIRNQVYHPITQDDWYVAEGKLAEKYVAVRTKGVNAESVMGAIRNEVFAMDADLPVKDLMTAQTMVDRQTGQLLLMGKLVAGFAALGAFLAGVGIYGVIARTVALRRGEIGIRMALGARVRDVVNMVLGAGIRLALGGAAIGFAGAFALGRLLGSTLPSMETDSGWVLGGTAAVLCLIALIASYAPARKAARIEPMEALRAE